VGTEECERINLQEDDIFAVIMSYQTCGPEEAMLETHDAYIDIQVSLVNSEAIDWFPRHTLEVKSTYDPIQDRTLYHRPGSAPLRVNNFPGFFTVLFPDDAHMPKQIVAGESELVKKVVVKVRKNLIF
jgi:YhcH/YjgK/YiaL family protein